MFIIHVSCRPAEDTQGWIGYLGSVVKTSANYLPSQVTEMLNQGRDFAIARLPFSGLKSICAIARCLIDSCSLIVSCSLFSHFYLFLVLSLLLVPCSRIVPCSLIVTFLYFCHCYIFLVLSLLLVLCFHIVSCFIKII